MDIKLNYGGICGAFDSGKIMERVATEQLRKYKLFGSFGTDQNGGYVLHLYGNEKRIRIFVNSKTGYLINFVRRLLKTAIASQNYNTFIALKEQLGAFRNGVGVEYLTNSCMLEKAHYEEFEWILDNPSKCVNYDEDFGEDVF